MSRKHRKSELANGPYGAPALEKGLDILELMAEQGEQASGVLAGDGLTQKQIADRLGRTPSEIFRMLACLERRGYVRRRRPSSELYVLTARLFALAHRHPPTRNLLEHALPAMRLLARQSSQSCHLAVRYDQEILIQAQVESPDPRNLGVRVGSRFPLLETGSGRALLAFMDLAQREQLLDDMSVAPRRRQALRRELDEVRKRGLVKAESHSIEGVIDLSAPVLDHAGNAQAAITVPFLRRRRQQQVDVDEVATFLLTTAADVSVHIGGGEKMMGT